MCKLKSFLNVVNGRAIGFAIEVSIYKVTGSTVLMGNKVLSLKFCNFLYARRTINLKLLGPKKVFYGFKYSLDLRFI